MNAEALIKKKLKENLGLKNGNSHFKIIIHDKEFHKLSRLQSHQIIYKCLSEEIDTFIHALEITIIDS